MTFQKGDRVRVVAEPDHTWHGKTGAVTRTPDEEANPGYGLGPSNSYAVRFDGDPHDAAPFHDADGEVIGSLIVPEAN